MSDGPSIEQSLVALQAQVTELSEERDEYQLSLLMLGLALGGDASVAAPEPLPVEQTVAEHTRGKPVRKPLPPNLPREEIELVPPEVERDPDAFELIETETREVLERRPSCTITVACAFTLATRTSGLPPARRPRRSEL